MAQGAKGFVQKVVDNDRDAAGVLTAEPEREGWTRETQALLRMAEIARKASEDARIAAQTRSLNTPPRALDSVQSEGSEPNGKGHSALQELRGELAVAQATLKDRETALARAHLDAERARENVMRETQALIERAEQSWKDTDTTHLALSGAARLEPSARIAGSTAAQRDTAPMAAARLRFGGDRIDAGALWEQFRVALVASGYMTHVLASTCLAVAAVVLYFGAPNFGPVTRALEPSMARPNALLQAAPATPPKVTIYPTAMVARGVNLRAYPSANSQIIAALPQGLKVIMIEKQGNWTLIKAIGANGRSEPLVGWTSLSFLNVDKDSNAKPQAAPGK